MVLTASPGLVPARPSDSTQRAADEAKDPASSKKGCRSPFRHTEGSIDTNLAPSLSHRKLMVL
jgi:hypothetical protein